MIRNMIIVALVVGFSMYLWATRSAQESESSSSTPETKSADVQHESGHALDDKIEYLERLRKIEEERENARELARAEREFAEYERQQQLEEAKKEAEIASRMRKWDREFNEIANRRKAWEDYNASKDAVRKATEDAERDMKLPRHGYPAYYEVPQQSLRRRYGNSATLEQNEFRYR
jgi:membrane protein involved in colicin uptake